ncbi:MAG: hypothetical protein AAF629_32460 [Chloroflexota bacterium]
MSNNRPITVYISAASDLITEREILARMVAELPVTLAWRIVQTPISLVDTLDLDAVQQADFHILVIGSDIRAPVGLELSVARYHRRLTHAYLKQGLIRTLAGQSFVKDAALEWQPFQSYTGLRFQVQKALIQHLLRFQLEYDLTLIEVEQLQDLQSVEAPTEQPAEVKDAGHSAVILSRERYEPSDGIALDHLVDKDNTAEETK